MSERIDHFAEARELLAANITADDWATGIAVMHMKVAAANVHATLALVEQQRIANLIALFQRDPEELTGGAASDFASEVWDHLADAPVRQALGLNK